MSKAPLRTTCGGASFVSWMSPELAVRTCCEQVGVGGACIFESILQAKWAAYTSNGIFGVPSVNKRLGLMVESRLAGQFVRSKLHWVPNIDGMYGFCRFLMALAGAALLNTPYFARSGAGYLKPKCVCALIVCNLQRDLCKMEIENGLLSKTNTLGFAAVRFSRVLCFRCG